ncbi:hypothetical protein PAPYR_5787 [Paratrimastix pyriformis]|uniref:Uncharacterized protein n=1 Tax=Paratrimastix pyriformis TaxID=342808 RepID=A0ABQ8UJK6_9EUKA|nr:hypothetical protein PAPYR_5787 [Paratrimastix pyriformis]
MVSCVVGSNLQCAFCTAGLAQTPPRPQNLRNGEPLTFAPTGAASSTAAILRSSVIFLLLGETIVSPSTGILKIIDGMLTICAQRLALAKLPPVRQNFDSVRRSVGVKGREGNFSWRSDVRGLLERTECEIDPQ